MSKKVLLGVLIWILYSVLLACSVDDQQGTHSEAEVFDMGESSVENAAAFTSVLSRVEDWVRDGEIVGAEILIIKNRKIVVHEAYGWMDKEEGKPMQKNTIFRVRSMTKPLIATAALMLREEGKLELEGRVSEYLDSFGHDASKAVTIEQLLTHTAGFAQPGFPRDYETYKSLKEAVDDLGATGPEFAPGTRYLYSDAGVAVLGAVIAEITGSPVEEVLQRTILTPLGMEETYCSLPEDEQVKERISATYYREKGEYIKYWDPSMPQVVEYFRASGGIYATPLDYAKFLNMWMNEGKVDDKRYLSEKSIREALTPSGFNEKYGYLWETGKAFGHGGSDGTMAFAIPEKDLMVLYFTQSRSTHTTELVKSMILKELQVSEANDFTRIDVHEGFYEDYVGKYKNAQVEFEIRTDGDSLLFKTADTSNQVFLPMEKDRFFHEDLDIQLSFVRDLSGDVIHVVVHQRGESLEVSKIK